MIPSPIRNAVSARRCLLAASVVAATLGLSACAEAVTPAELSRIKLPPGFSIAVYADVPDARSMAFAPELGTVFVGTRDDTLYAVSDRDGDGRAERVQVLSRRLRVPNGIAWRDGWLYVAEQHRIFRYRPGPGNLAPRNVEVLFDRLPDLSHHGWRYAAFGPDGRLYVSIGAPCNICDVDGLKGTIISMRPDGSDRRIFARGIRNSVGIAFHPSTGEAFFTDNGGDWLGDNIPADEFNHAPRAGLHFGYPHYAGGRTVSPDYRDSPAPKGARFPVIDFAAHTASLGIQFYRGSMFPSRYRNDAFVAQHGSWNRTRPIGYRVMRVRFDGQGRAVAKEVFAEGWLQGHDKSGRPVDIEELPDGSLLVSDDYADVIYRITYEGK